jgi:hypothetical protein
VGKNAVLHLISDDIYLSVKFTAWGGSGTNGFAYTRSTPPPAAPLMTGARLAGQAAFRITFTNTPGFAFSLLATSDLSLPFTNWPLLGVVTDAPPGSGSYQFTDPGAITSAPQKFYRIRFP